MKRMLRGRRKNCTEFLRGREERTRTKSEKVNEEDGRIVQNFYKLFTVIQLNCNHTDFWTDGEGRGRGKTEKKISKEDNTRKIKEL